MEGPEGSAPVVVALALDHQYAAWAATSIRSCLVAEPSSNICFEVVHGGTLTDEDRARLAQTATSARSSIRFHRVDGGQLSGLPTTPHFGTVVWLRFFLPELLGDRTKAIYLDSDTLVLSGIEELWTTSLDSKPIAAVGNVVEPDARPHVEALGISYPGGFFNSGVLLMDLERMRADRSADELFKVAVDRRDELVWPDQDALNVVFRERWLPLHPRWNTQNSFWAWREWAIEVFGKSRLDEAVAGPAIRHFEGPGVSKPWHYMCPYPGRRQYRAALAETPWAGIPLEGKSVPAWLARRLPAPMRARAYARLSRVASHAGRWKPQNRGEHR